MKVPNIDGNYATKDGSVKIRVTRKEIEFDIASGNSVHIIDDDAVVSPKKQSGKKDSLREIGKGLNNLHFILTGKDE